MSGKHRQFLDLWWEVESRERGGRVGSETFKLWNIRNIRNIINKTGTCKWVFWNFFWNIRNIIVEHYKNKGFVPAYMLWRNAALRTGFNRVVTHYLTQQKS